jgi:6-phosphogluconolactonase (cycloisomerase 2 family)
MKSLRRKLWCGVLALWCGVSVASLQAQQYIFTNNNDSGGKNSTTVLSVNGSGAVKALKTYLTGGKSASGGYFALTPVTFAHTRLGYCVLVSNGGDSTIAAFQANLFNGVLKAVKGSPFADGMNTPQKFGIGLAVGENRLLFAGNTSSNSISVMQISATCKLTLLQQVSVHGSPAGMKVTPDGKYLLLGYIGQVDSFAIDYSTGKLTELGPFNAQGSAAGVEISCDGSVAFFGDAASHTQVEVFSIDSSGSLKETDNFTNNNGQSSNNVLLSPDGTHLYVSNTSSNQITTLSVGVKGALTYDGSVKLNKPGVFALGLAMGTRPNLFVSEQNSTEAIGVLTVSGNTVKEVPGSPFQVMKNGLEPAGLTAVPPRGCK